MPIKITKRAVCDICKMEDPETYFELETREGPFVICGRDITLMGQINALKLFELGIQQGKNLATEDSRCQECHAPTTVKKYWTRNAILGAINFFKEL